MWKHARIWINVLTEDPYYKSSDRPGSSIPGPIPTHFWLPNRFRGSIPAWIGFTSDSDSPIPNETARGSIPVPDRKIWPWIGPESNLDLS